MRTEVIVRKIYKFDELSDKAKEHAIEHFRYNMDFAWQSENAGSVKAIAETMGWRYNWYSYDGIRYDVRYTFESDAGDLSGARALAYIENNFISRAEQPKTYWLGHVIYCDGRKNWKRKSKIWHTIDQCPFTGYCMDCCFEAAYKEWKKDFMKLDYTVSDFVDLVAEHLSRDWTSDNEYQNSDEGIIERIEVNDYEFTEDGSLY